MSSSSPSCSSPSLSLSSFTAAQVAAHYKTLGNTFFRNHRYTEAIDAYSRAIISEPNNATLYANRAAALMGRRMWAAVTADSLRAIQFDSTYLKAYSRLAQAYVHIGAYQQATAAYNEVLKLDSQNAQAKQGLVEIERAQMEARRPEPSMPVLPPVRSTLIPSFAGLGLELRDLPNKGRALCATRKFEAGELVLAAPTLTFLYSDQYPNGRHTTQDILHDVCIALLKYPEHINELLALFPRADEQLKELPILEHQEMETMQQNVEIEPALVYTECHSDDTALDASIPQYTFLRHLTANLFSRTQLNRIRYIIYYNAMSIGTSDDRIVGFRAGAGIYPAASYANHNCFPSCHRYSIEGDNSLMYIRTLRSIEAGEEISINYISPLLPRIVRQEQLWEGYDFQCTCERCTSNEWKERDARLEALLCPNTTCVKQSSGERNLLVRVSDTLFECQGCQHQMTQEQVSKLLSELSDEFASAGQLYVNSRRLEETAVRWDSLIERSKQFLNRSHNFFPQLYSARAGIAFQMKQLSVAFEYASEAYLLTKYHLVRAHPILIRLLLTTAACTLEQRLLYLREAYRIHQLCYGGDWNWFTARYEQDLRRLGFDGQGPPV